MALEDLIGNLAGQAAQLPLNYGQLFQSAYSPYFNYATSQADNMAGLGQAGIGAQSQLGQSYIGNAGQLGQSAMGLYGNLAGQQASMYQAELPMQMEMQKYNSLSPALGGLLGQLGLGGINISPIKMDFNRPDVMAGYKDAVSNSQNYLGGSYSKGARAVGGAYGQAVKNAKSYDDQFGGMFADMMDRMPTPPTQQQKAPMAAPNNAPAYRSLGSGPVPTNAPLQRPPMTYGAYRLGKPR